MHTKINLRRIIVYAILYIIVLLFFIFFHSYIFLMVFVVQTVMPIISIPSVFYLRNKLKLDMDVPIEATERGDLCYLCFKLDNPTWLLTLDVKVKLNCENTFYDNKNSIIVSMPTRIHSCYKLEMPFKLSMNGNVRFTVNEYRILDFLGFVEIKKSTKLKSEINVFPEKGEVYEKSLNDISDGMSEVEETQKKGYDFSEVTDVREYIPGDKLMNIHWKLSAKRDVLMVKERESMSNEQMIIMVSLEGNPQEVDRVVSLAYGLIKRLMAENVVVRMVWWNDKIHEFEVRRVLELVELNESYADMYNSKVYTAAGEIDSYFMSVFPEITAYVKVEMKDADADASVVEV
ncbi:MAG: DUF58 domain-containing protein [Lachnospiraceae bacterium]|nr:DUF58 domain-containing protein [Lachnospiraceae bacterium]